MTKWLNHGFTLFGGENTTEQKDANSILIDPLFRKAKNHDKISAIELWEREWNRNPEENQKRLQEAVKDADEVFFISMPGTSRKNMIPMTAAEFLAEKVGKNAYCINGDSNFIPIHTTMMKSVPHRLRLFYPRCFEESTDILQSLAERPGKKAIFIVEDLLTTGNSAHSFQRFLEKHGLQIHGIIAMKGMYKPNVPPKLVQKMARQFQNNGINIDAAQLSMELTEKEAQTLAFQTMATFKEGDSSIKKLVQDMCKELFNVRVLDEQKSIIKLEEMAEDLKRILEVQAEKNKDKQDVQQSLETTDEAIMNNSTQEAQNDAEKTIPQTDQDTKTQKATGLISLFKAYTGR